MTNRISLTNICNFCSLSKQSKWCESCIQYDVRLQQAKNKILSLEAKVQKLLVENGKLKIQVRIKSTDCNDPKKLKKFYEKTCNLCLLPLTEYEFDEHLCFDQESIKCSFCTTATSFKSTASLIEHISSHHGIQKSKVLFQCKRCILAYPAEILLKLHQKAHDKIVPKPISDHKEDFQEIIFIDEPSSERVSVLSESAVEDTSQNSINKVETPNPIAKIMPFQQTERTNKCNNRLIKIAIILILIVNYSIFQ